MFTLPVTFFNGEQNPMISTWNTENLGGTGSATKVILLPMSAGPTVDWGDGTVNNLNTHTYASGGSKTVKIYGYISDWAFADGGDKLKITDISKVGGLLLIGSAFYGCSNMTWTATDKPIPMGSINSAFYGCTLFNGNIGNWDVSQVSNAGNAFRDCVAFNQDLSSWEVSSITVFGNMFWGATIFNQDLSSWDVSSATLMQNMFRNTAFNQDLSAWDISNVTNLTNFLNGSSFSATNYDLLLPAWEAQSVQDSVTAHFGSAQYGAGTPATARADLIADHTWTITDGGAA